MVSPCVWDRLPCDEAAAQGLARDAGVSPLLARILSLRGVRDPEEAHRFLHPALTDLHDPFGLIDMRPAVECTLQAIAARRPIVVHGDYDVDGITSTVIVRRALELLGGEVSHFIPDRLRDGYGLLPATVERLHAAGAGVIISVDCGIQAIEAGRRARELGVDLIVTDHHEPGTALPEAVAVVNPKRRDCTYRDTQLAGVGVALKFVQALCMTTGRERWLPGFLKLAAIGTLADVVPLTGENRTIAKIGLDLLSRGPNRAGLQALLDVAGLAGRRLEGGHVSFALAPRVNAAGRMGDADVAARLLLTSDDAMASEAQRLAQILDEENGRRREEEAKIVAAARRQVETDPEIGARSVLVVAGEGWHRGVVGIVASKLVETFHRPAIVLALEAGTAHGSGRSVPGFDLLEALHASAGLLDKYGGHRHAAGLTLEAARVKEFRLAIAGYAEERLGPDDLRPRLRIDGTTTFNGLNGDVAEELSQLAPFGAGNPRPVLSANGVRIVDGPRPLKERHLKMALRQGGRTFRAVAWRAAERREFLVAHRESLEVAFSLEQNTFRGETHLELTLADARPASS